MPEESASSRPVRCTSCSRELESPVCCTGCGSLNPLDRGEFDFFEMFGLDAAYDIDMDLLRRTYLTVTRSIHPDMAGQGTGDQRLQSLNLSSQLNRAYETLRDPIKRARYLLQRSSTDTEERRAKLPPELLAEVMTLREEIEALQTKSDAAATASLRQRITQQRTGMIRQIATLARGFAGGDASVRDALTEQLDAISYWDSLLDQLPPATGGDESF